MSTKIYTKKLFIFILPIVIAAGSFSGLIQPVSKVGAQTAFDLNLNTKDELQKFCNNLIGGVVLSPSTPNLEGAIDQSGVLTSPCGVGFAAGFFGNKTKAGTCDPNFVTNPGGSIFPTFPTTPGQNPAPNPISPQDKTRCQRGYDTGLSERGTAINQATGQTQQLCNGLSSPRKEQCLRELDTCKNMPSKDKLTCFENLTRDYSQQAGPSAAAAGDDDSDCGGGLLFGWAICAAVETISNFNQYAFDNIIQPIMEETPLSTDSNDPIYRSWQSFRFIGNTLLIISMLAIVYSQARGGD